MNIKFLKKASIITASTLGLVYALFLVAPFIISPIANNYIPMVNDEIKKATGLNSKIEGFRIITTPKLTVGAGLGKFSVLTPDNREIITAKDFEVKMSLLPLFAKKIEIDLVKLGDFDAKFNLNKDGSFEIEKYLPKPAETQPTET